MKSKLAIFFFIASLISLNTKAQYEEEERERRRERCVGGLARDFARTPLAPQERS